MPASIKSLGYIQFTTHRVQVSHDIDSDHYVCFKSTDTRCDIDSFKDLNQAVDYIIAPMPNLVYTVELGEDPEA
jgi:hypothetical protein